MFPPLSSTTLSQEIVAGSGITEPLSTAYCSPSSFQQSATINLLDTEEGNDCISPADPVQDVIDYCHLAMCYEEQAKEDEAEKLYLEAFSLANLYLEQEDPLILHICMELGSIYCQQGQYKKAKPFSKRALAIAAKKVSLDEGLFVECLEQLVLICKKTNDYKEAERLCMVFLEQQQQVHGNGSLPLTSALNLLARCYVEQSKYSEAESIYLRVLSIEEFQFGTYSAEINTTVQALFEVFYRQGKITLAEFMLQKQCAILEKLHGPQSMSVASCLLKWAEMLMQAGRSAEALSLYQNVLDIYIKISGNQSNLVFSMRAKLSELFPDS